MRTTFLRSLVALFSLIAALALAQGLLPVPPLTGRVIDQTGTLTAQQQAAVGDRLARFEADAGTQIVVLVVPTTAPEDIAAYAQRVGEHWKIGRREVGDGLLVVVAKNDRTVRIEVAKTLEGAVPDLAARQIIDRAIVPAFRAGNFADGLNAGLDQLTARIRGEALPTPVARQDSTAQELDAGYLLAPLVLGLTLLRLTRRNPALCLTAVVSVVVGWLTFHSAMWTAFVGMGLPILALFLHQVGIETGGSGSAGSDRSSTSGGGGDRSSGGSGGGFSSGGGGDFGGGGASGKW